MDTLLTRLRACAEPTRLRLLALAARGSFCVTELTEILGQSQPRLSRHLKLLCEAGLLDRVREGANVWFALPDGAPGRFVRDLLAGLDDDATLEADRRRTTHVLAARVREASDKFRRDGADWDEMRALDLPAEQVGAALTRLLPAARLGRMLDIGTGTGVLLERLAPRVDHALGIDASRPMLALARERLARAGLAHATVRQADMYRLPLADAGVDLAVMQMVLHYAEDPEAALAEAARVLRPDGMLVVVDLAAHARTELAERLAHRWPGFGDRRMRAMLRAAGLRPGTPVTVPGKLDVRLWPATRPARRTPHSAPTDQPMVTA